MRLSRLHEYAAGVANLGLVSTLRYVGAKLRNRFLAPGLPLRTTSRYAKHPLQCRSGTSDLDVFAQIFVAREYRCLDDLDLEDVRLVIDCGANVGLSSAYFLSRFPGCQVIAIEPDQENFAQLSVNLAPYAGRYRAIHSAVWSHPVGLVPSEAQFGDGRQWAQSMRVAQEGEVPSTTAVDIGSILRSSGFDRISILKIDIEGAEEVVFSSGFGQWLGRTDNLVIELHGERAERIFAQAVAAEPFSVSRCEELTVCKRILGSDSGSI